MTRKEMRLQERAGGLLLCSPASQDPLLANAPPHGHAADVPGALPASADCGVRVLGGGEWVRL